MKRILIMLTGILMTSLSACASSTPQPEIDFVPPALTSTAQEKMVELASTTPQPSPTQTQLLPTVTQEATQPPAQMPPLNTGGWQRVGEGLPFTFELPDGWVTPDGYIKNAPYWVPAGVPFDEQRQWLAVNEVERVDGQEPQSWPQNSAVESRAAIESNGASYTLVQVKVFNGEGGTENAYEAHVLIPFSGTNKVYGLYVSSPTKEGRAALQDILIHAVETLAFIQ